jgi:hypothetical protein
MAGVTLRLPILYNTVSKYKTHLLIDAEPGTYWGIFAIRIFYG